MHGVKAKAVLSVLAGVLAVGLLGLAWTQGAGVSGADQGAMQNCPLQGRWAISVWTGDDNTNADQAFATCGEGSVVAAYSLDRETQVWSHWFAGHPDMTNLTALNNLQGVLALGGAGASAAASAGSSDQLNALQNCPLQGRWSISVWSGEDDTDPEQAFASCGSGAVQAAYYIDPETQSWLRWFAGRQEISNLTPVNDMQGVVALGRAQAPASPTASPTATPPPIVNQTTHGVIGWDEIWRDEIRIIGDIIVEEGATLTIEPGTVVLIAANQDVDNLNDAPWGMQEGFEYGRPVETSEGNLLGLDEPYWDEGHHVSIRVLGTLHAVGTPEQMITITSDSATPGIYDWNFFAFAHGTLSYSIVQYYRCLNAGNEAEVSHNILRHIGGAGVAPGSAVIEHNTISYGTHESINIDHSSPVIRYNHLGPNPGHAGIVIDGGSPQIVGNTIEGCAAGIALISPPDDPVIEGNTFLNNEEDIVRRY